MKDIIIFHKILFPTDFSKNSFQNIAFAINLAKQNKAELIILYAYRLIKVDSDDQNEMVDLKTKFETEAKLKFNKWKESILDSAQINFSFSCDIGFLSDRIISNVNKNKIDLVVISNKMKPFIEEKVNNSSEISNNIACSVLILPELAH